SYASQTHGVFRAANGTSQLTVKPAHLTIVADNQAMTYGGAMPALTASYLGLVNGDTPASLAVPPTLSTAPAPSHAGAYPITASGAVAPNYTISVVAGTLTVTPAPLSIIADSQAMAFGGAVPALTASYLGLVNGDTPASLATAIHLSTTATSN